MALSMLPEIGNLFQAFFADDLLRRFVRVEHRFENRLGDLAADLALIDQLHHLRQMLRREWPAGDIELLVELALFQHAEQIADDPVAERLGIGVNLSPRSSK